MQDDANVPNGQGVNNAGGANSPVPGQDVAGGVAPQPQAPVGGVDPMISANPVITPSQPQPTPSQPMPSVGSPVGTDPVNDNPTLSQDPTNMVGQSSQPSVTPEPTPQPQMPMQPPQDVVVPVDMQASPQDMNTMPAEPAPQGIGSTPTGGIGAMPPQQPPVKPPKSRKTILIVIIVVVLLLVGASVLALVFMSGSSSNSTTPTPPVPEEQVLDETTSPTGLEDEITAAPEETTMINQSKTSPLDYKITVQEMVQNPEVETSSLLSNEALVLLKVKVENIGEYSGGYFSRFRVSVVDENDKSYSATSTLDEDLEAAGYTPTYAFKEVKEGKSVEGYISFIVETGVTPTAFEYESPKATVIGGEKNIPAKTVSIPLK